jgi:hypothetical protein
MPKETPHTTVVPLTLIHRSTWKEYSRKSRFRIVHRSTAESHKDDF